jgi:hypothetical protein
MMSVSPGAQEVPRVDSDASRAAPHPGVHQRGRRCQPRQAVRPRENLIRESPIWNKLHEVLAKYIMAER